jgi:general secretion pathway protein G
MSMHPSRSSRRRARRAFSLIEILIAVTILGIMAAVFVPRLGFLIGSSKQKRAFSEMATLSNQITIYMTQNGMSSLGDDFELAELIEGDPPFMPASALKDPWKNDYVLEVDDVPPGLEFDLICYGADGQPGGEGEDADIRLSEPPGK